VVPIPVHEGSDLDQWVSHPRESESGHGQRIGATGREEARDVRAFEWEHGVSGMLKSIGRILKAR
jgi:hypothetical protein